MDLEQETVVHPEVDDQPGGIERIGNHAIQGQVRGAGFGLVGQETEHRLRGPLLDLHLRIARPHPTQVPRERVRQQVLAGAVQAEVLGQLGWWS